MNDFDRIARVIEYLAEHYREQPSLDTLAKLVDLSPAHFHKIFHRWAGTTPKQFVQHLTAIEAGQLLRDGSNVLNASLDVGLSGPGRLHDLCVKLEGATPGEIRSGGQGLEIVAGQASTPFGEAFIARAPRGLCWLSYPKEPTVDQQRLQEFWPEAVIRRDDETARREADRIFPTASAKESGSPFDLFVRGSAFQLQVWRALVAIPFGEVRSYGQVATAIGKPGGARAVGNVAAVNQVGFLVPCHRVIQATGAVGQFYWGPTRKKAMLAWERSRIGC